MVSGLRAPCMRQTGIPYAAGFLQRSWLCLALAVQRGAEWMATEGRGMIVVSLHQRKPERPADGAVEIFH